MTIDGKKEGTTLGIALEGRLDTATGPELEKYLKENLGAEITEVCFDFEKLSYISSAGLRILLSTRKQVGDRSGSVKLKNMNDLVMDIFNAVGFAEFFEIEK